MKSVHIDSFQIHSNTAEIDYRLEIPIEGMGFPSIANANRARSGEHGTFVSNSFYRERRVIMKGIIVADSVTEYEQNRRALENAIRIVKDNNGVVTPKSLKFVTMDDLSLQVNAHVQDFQCDIANITHGRFLIDFLCADFGLESQTLKISNFDVPAGGGAVYPVIYPVVYDAATGGNFNVQNLGSAEAFPKIIFNGPLTSPFVQNLTTGRTFKLNINIGGGSQIVVDMKEKTIIEDGSTNRLSYLADDSSFWTLEPGVNNINFDTENTGDTGDMQLQFRDTYIGI